MIRLLSGAPRHRVAVGLLAVMLLIAAFVLAFRPAGTETKMFFGATTATANAPPTATQFTDADTPAGQNTVGFYGTTIDDTETFGPGIVGTMASYAAAARDGTAAAIGATITAANAFEADGFNVFYAVMFALFAGLFVAALRRRYNFSYADLVEATTMTQRWHQARAGRRSLRTALATFDTVITTNATKLTQTVRRMVSGTGTADALTFAGPFAAA